MTVSGGKGAVNGCCGASCWTSGAAEADTHQALCGTALFVGVEMIVASVLLSGAAVGEPVASGIGQRMSEIGGDGAAATDDIAGACILVRCVSVCAKIVGTELPWMRVGVE